ncbi:hypothetical protein [Marinobacter arenosus]|uniref:hypothetical protein n=1 Tax=Marinobacter arenosus TaxID=2856822 RepID=UPI001C4BA2A5|nr:hypothetical protein [Marinobacter arenosus]MBW0147938.1 hypothetical protein [Marinobacter arenosus]
MFGLIKRSDAPHQVKRASMFLLSYALIVLVGTLFYAFESGGEDTRELFRGLIRVAGISYIAWWLLSLKKEAWWFAVGACGFLSLLGLVGIGALLYAGSIVSTDYYLLVLKLIAPLYLLIHALVILVREDTRSLFIARHA